MTTLQPTEYTIDELEARLDDVDDPDRLASILEAERDGEDRKGAKETIRAELDDARADEDDVRADQADAEADRDDAEADSRRSGDSTDGVAGVLDIRNRARTVAEDLVGSPLDAVTEVQRDGDEWRVVVDVVERSAVPDTQDIIGRYEVRFDEGASILGYQRLTRFRRSDTSDEL